MGWGDVGVCRGFSNPGLSFPPPHPRKVLLVTSSFMSPSESKAGTNLNRVRMFGPDKLVKAAAEKKWDRVKIVCTQPYTKVGPLPTLGPSSAVQPGLGTPRILARQGWKGLHVGE